MNERDEITPVENPYPHVMSGCGSRDCPACAWDHSQVMRQLGGGAIRCPGCDRWVCDGCDGDLQEPPDHPDNPYRHDHNPLNADFHGGTCSACEWERDLEVHVTERAIRVLGNAIATLGDLLSPSDLAELRAGLERMTEWVQRNDPARYPESADRFHHCVNGHEWWGPAFPTCPICHADRRES